ncbi:MAG: phosphoribosyltransferase, partial [Chloroflexota bacterium]|nr:phosphoribosyltransferase [Chloroflexota bacterium]
MLPLFRDRTDAAAQLAERLARYHGQDVLVLGIPRGGVPVAAEVARRLDGQCDVVVARKLGAPAQPELGIGAVTASGGCYLDASLAADAQASAEFVERAIAREVAEARRQEQRYRAGRPPPRVQGRIVIVVDDGLATGATMRAALRAVREAGPARVVTAVPVAPAETCERLCAEADEVVAVHQPRPFLAVGLHYA